MNKFKTIDWVFMILLVIGGLNWGLVGLLDFDLVAAIFGEGAALSRIVYALVGVSAVYLAVVLPGRVLAQETKPLRQTAQ